MNPYPTLWMYIFHCKRDNSGDFQWLAVVWISSSLICNNLNIKNFNFLFITDEEEKISFINFVLKNLIESLSYLIIYILKLKINKKLWWVSRVHIIKDEVLLGLITLLLWWGEGEGDFACHNYIKKAILTFNNFRFCLFNFYKEQNPIVFYYLIDHLFQLTSFLQWRNDFHSHTRPVPP